MSDEIRSNHKKFVTATTIFEKLKIAARNGAIQLKVSHEAMAELQKIAKGQGYWIDEISGTLIAYDNKPK